MKILHINCNYIGTTLHQLMVEKLDSMGIENRVFVPTYDRTVAVIRPNENVCVSECFRKWDRLVFDYKQHKILRAVDRQYDISGFDVVHAYTLFTDGNCARKLHERYGVPYVVAVRNTDVNDFFAKMVHLRRRGIRIMLDAERICFLSQAYKDQVFQKYIPARYRKALEAKTEIITNGIDDFWFENRPVGGHEPQDPIRLLYAGRIDKNKNVPAIQAAMDVLRQRGVQARLTVVGKAEDAAEYDRIQSDAYTTCLPAMQKEELIRLYRESDLFVMPSFKESFGLVYAEAMSQGLPVIYTAGQGFDRQFEEGVVGYHVSAKDPRDIADAMQNILSRYSEISERCVEKARAFQWDAICQKYAEIYQNCLPKKTKR